jgi:mannose-6-phosphate isomerase-like protein (cupin superfamily)
LFGDSKKAKGLRSGYVTLKPKESVGQHNTGPSEEVIFIISGSGVVSYGVRGKIKIKKNAFIYIPPELAHNVINTGKKRLKYLYTAARVQG